MQTKQELEDWYATVDPWGYETNPSDLLRKQKILNALKPLRYKKALDIGCGEGWITKDLPADIIHGLELSDTASQRLPKNVKRVTKPKGNYDLIVATGVLYKQYDYQNIMSWMVSHIKEHGTILTCHIKNWEQPLPTRARYVEEFPYREYTQILRRYEW